MVRDVKGRFIKGSSGNPLGRAKRKAEDEFLAALGRRVSLADWVAVIDKALGLAKVEGDARARQWLSDYLIGKPIQRVEHAGQGGGPLQAVVATDDVSNLTDEELDARLDRLFGWVTEAGTLEAGDGAEAAGGTDGH